MILSSAFSKLLWKPFSEFSSHRLSFQLWISIWLLCMILFSLILSFYSHIVAFVSDISLSMVLAPSTYFRQLIQLCLLNPMSRRSQGSCPNSFFPLKGPYFLASLYTLQVWVEKRIFKHYNVVTLEIRFSPLTRFCCFWLLKTIDVHVFSDFPILLQ